MKRDSGSHKPTSSHARAPEYNVKVASHSFVSLEREYMDLVHRYSRLYVPTDFSRSVSLWTQVNKRRALLASRPANESLSLFVPRLRTSTMMHLLS